ncbi:toll-like receptor 13 [Mytilus galloprovincialis]|uniref:Toll-like receptor 13 n=3 Tax=Mytilus galloprovincialis TaxID=29158 RepID=A0A8B6FLM4_MYTGA|nr:toll-like receptor 13 [Mytilus galloprovincialis]
MFLIINLMFVYLTVGRVNTDAARGRECYFSTKCRCFSFLPTQNYNAVCSNSKLHAIPVFKDNIHSIDLSYNRIQKIQNKHFSNNGNLKELNLSHNKIKSLSKNSFYGLRKLSMLIVSQNAIDSVETNTFFYLQSLAYLDMKHTRINVSTLQSLLFLKTLRMDFILNESNNLSFTLLHLKHLDLSGMSGRCEARTLTEDVFKFIPNIEDLNLSACKINWIYKGTFKFMRNLSILDLSYNQCLTFSEAENVTHDLIYTSIKVLKVNKIHKTFQMNTMIKRSHLRNLKGTNLIELQVNSNRIQKMEKGALLQLPSTLRTISMSDNEFSYGDYLSDVIFLPVEHANISELFKSHIPSKYEERCEHRNESNFQEEEIKNHISSIRPNFVPLPLRLKSIVYRNCLIRYEIPAMKMSENSIEYFDGHQNMFFSLIGPLCPLDHMRYLDLSGNMCSNVSKVFFKCIGNLQILRLQNNLLGFVLPDDVNGEVLQYVPDLREINLSENRIPTLPYYFFKSQVSVRRLYLDGNLLDYLIFKIDHMKNLNFLGLSNNRFSYLDKPARDQLETVFKNNKNLSIDISGNPLKCTCDTKDFIQWMGNTKIIFNNLHFYSCRLSTDKKQNLNNPNRLYEVLQKECVSYTSLVIGLISLVGLFVSILTFGLVYRHRWRIRYMYYMVKIRYFETKQKTHERKIYRYDAFVSYESNDRSFVHGQFLRKLENDAGLKLCIHQRDFLPGRDIAENITSAIHDSRKIVVIMSPNYLNSYWCMFEYNMARVESIYSRNKENILFLVFLQQMSPRSLPLLVLELVQSQSYIEYPNDEYGDTVFWEKLKEVLT